MIWTHASRIHMLKPNPVKASRKSPAGTGDQNNWSQNWWAGTTCWTSNIIFLRVRAPGVLYVGCRHTPEAEFQSIWKLVYFPSLLLRGNTSECKPRWGIGAPTQGVSWTPAFVLLALQGWEETATCHNWTGTMPGGGKSSIKITGLTSLVLPFL